MAQRAALVPNGRPAGHPPWLAHARARAMISGGWVWLAGPTIIITRVLIMRSWFHNDFTMVSDVMCACLMQSMRF